MTKRLSKKARDYLEAHRNGNELAFDTSPKGYSERLALATELIGAGILEGDEPRHAGAVVWYPILRTAEERSR